MGEATSVKTGVPEYRLTDLDEFALTALPLALLLLDEAGTIMRASQAAGELLGVPVGELAGSSARRRFPAIEPYMSGGREGCQDDRGECVFGTDERGANRTIGFRVASVPYGPHLPTAIRYAVFLRDISDLVDLRRERDRLLKLATVGEVMPTILHELRNPVAAITTSVEVAIEELPPGADPKMLYAILSEARRISASLEGLGAAARDLRTTRHMAIDHAIRECCNLTANRMAAVQIGLVQRVSDMPLVRLDAGTVRAVLFNLLNNAINACSAGDVVEVGAKLDENRTCFVMWVKDTGPGMSAETLSRCTELFYSTRRSGSGIGLALCAKTAEEAGGSLRIQSALGAGTEVVLRIPIEKM